MVMSIQRSARLTGHPEVSAGAFASCAQRTLLIVLPDGLVFINPGFTWTYSRLSGQVPSWGRSQRGNIAVRKV